MKRKVRNGKRMAKAARRVRELPEDIVCADTDENIFYRFDISAAGYRYEGDWTTFLKERYGDLPEGIEVWSNGIHRYLFVPKHGQNGTYAYGGIVTGED